MIGLLRRKYTILKNTLTGDLLTCNPHGNPQVQVPMIDRLSKFALDLSTCVAPLFHLIRFVSIKYTVGEGGLLGCVFMGMCLSKEAPCFRLN